ncbi:MAG: hypothetical protein KF716_11795 [Anaerolineae bacterium]|nr:hypothetical protein [Anaerolineae bacterium]
MVDHPASTDETRLLATLTPASTTLPDLSTMDTLSAWILAEDGSSLVR